MQADALSAEAARFGACKEYYESMAGYDRVLEKAPARAIAWASRAAACYLQSSLAEAVGALPSSLVP